MRRCPDRSHGDVILEDSVVLGISTRSDSGLRRIGGIGPGIELVAVE